MITQYNLTQIDDYYTRTFYSMKHLKEYIDYQNLADDDYILEVVSYEEQLGNPDDVPF